MVHSVHLSFSTIKWWVMVSHPTGSPPLSNLSLKFESDSRECTHPRSIYFPPNRDERKPTKLPHFKDPGQARLSFLVVDATKTTVEYVYITRELEWTKLKKLVCSQSSFRFLCSLLSSEFMLLYTDLSSLIPFLFYTSAVNNQNRLA